MSLTTFTLEKQLRCKRHDVKQMNSADSTDVVHDDGKGMKFTNCERTAASDDFPAFDNHLTYQLTNFIRKVSLSTPVMSQVSPVEGIDLIEKQKSNWVIQKMNRVLEGSEILRHDTQLTCKNSFPKIVKKTVKVFKL